VRTRALYGGLFLTTLATLVLEIANGRLLSVVTWYHLSFFAVSLAMLGTGAGAVTVFTFGAAWRGDAARRALALGALAFAVSIPLCHVASLVLPLPLLDVASFGGFARALPLVSAITAPFYLSGIVVTIALTRLDAPIGRVYAADLVGAAAGCLLVIPLLETSNVTAAVFASGLLAATGAMAFARFAERDLLPAISLAAGLGAITAVAASGVGGIGIVPAKGVAIPREEIAVSAWNTHSNVLALHPSRGPAFYWGPGEGAEEFEATTVEMLVDGGACTKITAWDRRRASLDWVRHDVTYLPYHLRRGDAVIIGVGGGRDVLSALAAGCDSITGIEVNRILVDLLRGPYREFAGIADAPGVVLVHDEARSYLARTERRFDVVQMSLIDTWAATGAGAFALSENGLYTLEAWRLFLGVLRPGGVLAVSRWFSPSRLSETNRVLALGTAALLDAGVSRPEEQLVLVSRGNVATLLVSVAPFTAADRAVLEDLETRFGFVVLLAPGRAPAIPAMGAISSSRSRESLRQATADPVYDFRPPTDERPYFFNMLRLSSVRDVEAVEQGALLGNVRATSTLMVLLAATVVLTAAILLGPLGWAQRPHLEPVHLAVALVYFAALGAGFMLLQFALLQRFSVFLGHPTWSLAIVLFSMILFTGLGSLLSDRVDVTGRRALAIPAAIAAGIAALTAILPIATQAGMGLSLPLRAAVVLLVTAPLSTLLGFCFPIGMRLVGRSDAAVTPWLWGVNGAFSVLGSVCALVLSMVAGISTTLGVAALLYALLGLSMLALRREAARAGRLAA